MDLYRVAALAVSIHRYSNYPLLVLTDLDRLKTFDPSGVFRKSVEHMGGQFGQAKVLHSALATRQRWKYKWIVAWQKVQMCSGLSQALRALMLLCCCFAVFLKFFTPSHLS